MHTLRRPGLQVAHLLGELLGGRVGIRVQRQCDAHVAAGRPAHPQVDSPRRQRLQHAKLLRHLQCAVVRQHHAGAADADAPSARGDRGHQDLGRTADDGGQAVVLAEPEAFIAERLAMLGKHQRVADRRVFIAPGKRRRLIEHGQAQHEARHEQGQGPIACHN
jgi:hypothetical protein